MTQINAKTIQTFLQTADLNEETVAVGCELLIKDRDLLTSCSSATELESKVLEKARLVGQYASLNYDANEFLDPDDDNFAESDGGLSWVTFGDLWDVLKTHELS